MRGSLHFPFYLFDSNLSKIHHLIQDRQKDCKNAPQKHTVVFHCHYSQTRGPAAAQSFQNFESHTASPLDCDVCVLEGGFKHFRTAFQDDPEVYEDL